MVKPIRVNTLISKMENILLSDDDFMIDDSSEDEQKTNHETKIYFHCVLSIDIGIKHLGISVTFLHANYTILETAIIDLIDIQRFEHNNGISKKDCKLGHTKTFCDWINHVFQEHSNIFEKATVILIERQPPTGLVGIEQLIFSKWRDKAILISPTSMHKFFHIGHYDYEQRKTKTIEISQQHLKLHSSLLFKFNEYKRRHDIADSICIMLFWIHNKQEEYSKNERKERAMKAIVYDRKKDGYKMGVNEWFEQFRYHTNN